jgi:hypothetical protein
MTVAATGGELRWLKAGCASIWLTTALGVLHPFYREVGHGFLSRLGLPDWLMWATCAGELVLAALVLVLRPPTWLFVLQAGAVTTFTLILGVLEPMLLVHPYGVLSKNYPFLALVAVTWLVAREGWTPRVTWLLRGGMALVWVTEGIFPKVFFQQPMELAVVSGSGLVPLDPSTFLVLLGLAQAASGVAAVLARGKLLVFIVGAQALALLMLPALVSWQDPTLWVHPFGPMTKNLPILACTLMVLHRCRR